MRTEALKPVLHNSQMEMALRCGEQFRRRYIENEKIAPRIQLVVGCAIHDVAKQSLTFKKESGLLMPVEQVADIARDTIVSEWEKEGVTLTDDEAKEGLSRVKGNTIDTVVNLAVAHNQFIAPDIQPIDIEQPWVIKCDGYPYDLAGQFDVNETNKYRDLKTSKMRKNQAEVDKSIQLSIYALAWKVTKGIYPSEVILDVLIKTQSISTQKLISHRDDNDVKVFLRRFEAICLMLEKEVFLPSNVNDWWCSDVWCGYAKTCPYYSGRKSVFIEDQEAKTVKQPKTKIKKEKVKHERISKNNPEWAIL